MTSGQIHIVGAGLAGLAASLALATEGFGRRLCLHEASNHAGGRCRSFEDAALGCSIDNGNHLILGANPAVFAYLDALGGRAALATPPETLFPFLALAGGQPWPPRPHRGPGPGGR